MSLSSFYSPVTWNDHLDWFRNVSRKRPREIYAIRILTKLKLIGTCQIISTANGVEFRIRIGDVTSLNKGYGKKAMIKLFRIAKARGITKIYLDVFPDNLKAIHIYEKLNVKYINSRIVQGNNKHLTVLRMEKIL